MSKETAYNRRRFLGNAFMALGAVELARTGFGPDQFSNLNSMDATFDQLKQIEAGDLKVGYAEAGPGNGPVVMLLHGWPYDIHSFVEVTPLLVSAGYRVIIPYL